MLSLDTSERRNGVPLLQVSAWKTEHSWLAHAFSTRFGAFSASHDIPVSDFNLGFTAPDQQAIVSENRQNYLEAIALTCGRQPPAGKLLTARQMHSGLVRRVDAGDLSATAPLWGDGLSTNEPGLWLGIQTADCLPVLLADTKLHAVAALHAGWRGTLKGIVQNAVGEMRREFGTNPKDLIAAIGPGIGPCCFTVGEEVRQLFRTRFPYADSLFTTDGALHMNLAEANRQQLLASGLSPLAVSRIDECTGCQTDRFFSYRAERGRTGRMMAVIGVLPVPS